MALMNGVFEVIERAISEHDVQRVLQVRLKVGELTNADKEALELAFEAYAKGTPCEGAELIVQRIPVKARCTICQQEFLVNNVISHVRLQLGLHLIYIALNNAKSKQPLIQMGQKFLLKEIEICA
ncbi:MAG: hydrogenase maturation nickel metallochaperone HypA, partial [Desulfitobacterium hafniense]|nr:hydrogenase maturation nickel metallochaperone HypA [Desulfitobacterium hafniense]